MTSPRVLCTSSLPTAHEPSPAAQRPPVLVDALMNAAGLDQREPGRVDRNDQDPAHLDPPGLDSVARGR